MDEIVNKEEIVKTMSRTTNTKLETFEVRAVRPAFGSKQNATLIMRESDAVVTIMW